MSLNSLKARVKYHGGQRQVDRMIEDKERSFKDSLWRSYQSATAVLEDGREFRCLINPNKISMEADDKMLSIPFKDICLTSQEIEDIGIKCGSVIEWKENNTHWIVYSRYLQEIAYFRGLMRQCADEALEIGDKKFYYYLKGPDEKGIEWQKTKNFIFNKLNYTIEIYISNTQETNEFFHRFAKCKIKGKPFEVQAVDELSTEGILVVYLKETYADEWEDVQEPEEEIPPVEEEVQQTFSLRRNIPIENSIIGPLEVYPYDIIQYTVAQDMCGKWCVSNNKARIIEQNGSSVKIEITTGKSGSVSLIYEYDGINISYDIKILSL